jgi:hypothetical protein
MNIVLTLTALSVVSGFPDRPDKLQRPKGPGPMRKLAFLDQRGGVTVQGTIWKDILVPEKTGKMVRRKVPYTQVIHYPPGSVGVFDTDGKKVCPKALVKLLKNPVPVLVSADGKKVDPYYLRGVKKGTLILVLPQAQTGKPPPRVGKIIILGGMALSPEYCIFHPVP